MFNCIKLLTENYSRISSNLLPPVITRQLQPVSKISKTDARKIDALDQWCLHMLLGIKWYQFVRNDDVRRLMKQPKLTAIIQSLRVTLFWHIMRMDDNVDAKRILLASPPADWRRQLGHPHIMWLSTV